MTDFSGIPHYCAKCGNVTSCGQPKPDHSALLAEADRIWPMVHEAAGANMKIMMTDESQSGDHDVAVALAEGPEHRIVDLVQRLAAALRGA